VQDEREDEGLPLVETRSGGNKRISQKRISLKEYVPENNHLRKGNKNNTRGEGKDV